jgi:predicted short-subunit dehydrogenase-like oxidoreductase (DUF2520 family)
MLPGMALKPRVIVVGAGNFGSALALALRKAGYTIEGIMVRSITARSPGASLNRAQKLAQEIGTSAVDFSSAKKLPAEIVWFAVPDTEIAGAARTLADKIDWKKKVALHSSGALTSDELAVLRMHGASVASVHPLMTFVRGALAGKSAPSVDRLFAKSPLLAKPARSGAPVPLAHVSFGIEGDALAVRAARRVVRDFNGHAYAIRKKDKAAYHAWATFISPLFTALLATAERVAHEAGVPAAEARRRMIPILQQTLDNYANLGAAAGFSGPIVRGDVDTVERHLRALRGVPLAEEVYRALATAALEYLPAKNGEGLRRALRSRSR